MIARLLEARERATAIRDWMLVAEIDNALARYGYVKPGTPEKRKPGRPRKNS